MTRRADNVTRSQSFAAVIRAINGVKTLVMKSQRWYQYQIAKFKDGEEVTLEIHTRRPKRTEQQNRYYWGVYLPEISAKTGERSLDRLHELFKGEFLTSEIVEVLGRKVRMKGSTTDLGIAEFSQYIMDIEEFTGVQAPPTENYGLMSIEEGIKYHDGEEH
jgi:hypothetical protein